MNAPLFSAADAKYLDDLADERDKRGAAWCSKKGVGRERDRAEAHPSNVTPIFQNPELEAALQSAREMRRMTLTIFCRSCARCERGQE